MVSFSKRLVALAMLLGLAVTTGCGSVPADDEGQLTYLEDTDQVSTTTAKLNGGIRSYDQDQAVLIEGIPAGWCSATLIAPRWFLTAAHCINYDDSTGGTLKVFRTSSRNPLTRTIDKIYTLGKDVDEPIQPFRDHDIALGRLVSDVPQSRAVPSRISSVHPIPGDPVVQFGFGPDQVKRYKNWYWGGDPDTNQGGDSGGPVFRGHLNGSGDVVVGGTVVFSPEIWGVASGTRDGAPQHDYDLHGKPVIFKHYIEEQIRDTDNGLEWGMNRGGFTYNTYRLPSGRTAQDNALLCKAYCGWFAECKSFTYSDTTRNCYLKDAIPNSKPHRSSVVISGVVGGFEYDVDRRGGDYNCFNFTSGPASAEDCADRCENNFGCRSFTFITSQNRCCLKDQVGKPSRATGMVSGVRVGLEFGKYSTAPTYETWSMGIDTFPEKCQAECSRQWLRCTSWSYHRPGGGLGSYCELKNGTPNLVVPASPDRWISGVSGEGFQRCGQYQSC